MRRSALQNAAIAAGLAFLFAIVLVPFWWVVTGAFKEPREIIARVPTFVFPEGFTLQHFERLLRASDFPQYLANSLMVATASMAITVVLAVLAGYAFFRLEFRGRETLYRLVLIGYAFPTIVILIPLYIAFARMGLVDTRLALVVVNVTFALPFAIWMMRTFFASVPRELEEAAMIDGAGTATVITRILVPLLAPGIASVAIFAFVMSWTEYLFASTLILTDERRTIPAGLSGIIGQYQIDWGMLLAGATLTILPVLVIFSVIGRWFVAGLTEGAVK